MRYVIALTGVVIIAISALGVVAPESLVTVIAGWSADRRLLVAVGTRLVLGVIFILGARSCRVPAVIHAVGVLAVLAAMVLLGLGSARLDALINWWSQRPPLLIRAWCLLGVLLGTLVLSSARRPTGSS